MGSAAQVQPLRRGLFPHAQRGEITVVSDGSYSYQSHASCAAAVGTCGCRRGRMELAGPQSTSAVLAECWGAILALELVLEHPRRGVVWHTDHSEMRQDVRLFLAGVTVNPPTNRFPSGRPLFAFAPPRERARIAELLDAVSGRLIVGSGVRQVVRPAHRACSRMQARWVTPRSFARRCAALPS